MIRKRGTAIICCGKVIKATTTMNRKLLPRNENLANPYAAMDAIRTGNIVAGIAIFKEFSIPRDMGAAG
jgi:hypothetical protein